MDHHLAQDLKQRCAKILNDKLVNDEAFAEEWYGLSEGTYLEVPRGHDQVRVGQAWEELCKVKDFNRV